MNLKQALSKYASKSPYDIAVRRMVRAERVVYDPTTRSDEASWQNYEEAARSVDAYGYCEYDEFDA